MDEDNVIDFNEATLNRLRNLKPYRNKTDAEIIAAVTQRKKVTVKRVKKPVSSYDQRFEEKLAVLQKEFAVDMNDSNDVENLRNLVRHQIQLENVNNDIDAMQRKESLSIEDYRTLKNLGDFQRGLITSVNDLQGQLGISRKQRKEKDVDDIPQWIDSVLKKSKEFFDRKTTKIACPKCQIELARIWYNFPQMENEIQTSLQCWKCKEKVEYIE